MKKHQGLSFGVSCDEYDQEFRDPKKAIVQAFVLAATGRKVTFDVVAHSRTGAKAWAGEAGVESYDEDPEASVFERYELSLNFQGRVA